MNPLAKKHANFEWANNNTAVVLCPTMAQQLQAVNFNYMEDEEWCDYFHQMERFVEEAKTFHRFRQELIRKCDGMPYDELQEQLDCSQVLLGGVNENGEYRDRSLAQLYKELLGLQFENLTDVIEKQRQDIAPSTTVVIEETPFITDFLTPALTNAETALQLAHKNNLFSEPEINTEYDFQDLLLDQNRLSQLLTDLINQLQAFLPNYDQRALFLWTLDNVPGQYLSTAYPELGDGRPMQWLNEMFGLEPVFVPNIKETDSTAEERKEQYTVYAYRNESLGETLIKLYQLVWDKFHGIVRHSLKLLFPETPNFKQEFLNEAHKALDQIGATTPHRTKFDLSGISENLRIVGNDEDYSGNRGNTTQAEYHISGVTLNSYDYAGYSTSKNYSSYSNECELSLLYVLDELAPGLFLLNGLEFELDIDQNSMEVQKL